MLPDLPHREVTLTGEPGATIALPKDTASREINREIELNPGCFTDFNRLKLELLTQFTVDCEDPHDRLQ